MFNRSSPDRISPLDLFNHLNAPVRALVSARSSELGCRPLKLAIACSGGRDSQALTGLVSTLLSGVCSDQISQENGNTIRGNISGNISESISESISELIIFTVDHGLYEGSGDNARALSDYWLGRGFSCEVLRADPELVASGEGIEDGARRARYAALEEAARRAQVDLVLLAHHAGDQAETFLMRALSSAGLKSLGGIPKRRGLFARPWLDVDPTLIHQLCDALSLPIFEDPTNRDPSFMRNAIRLQVAPTLEAIYGPKWVSRVTRTAGHLASDSRALSALIRQRLGTALTLSRSLGIAHLDWAEGLEEPSEIARVGLREFYQRALFELTPESNNRRRVRAQLELIEEVWRGHVHQRRSLPLGLELWGGRGVIEIYSSQVALAIPERVQIILPISSPEASGDMSVDEVHFEWGPWRLTLTRDVVGRGADLARATRPLALALPEEGARYKPHRSPGSKRVRRLWGDRKRSVFERERLPVLIDAESRVLWAPHCRPAAWLCDMDDERDKMSALTWRISWTEI